MTSRIADDRTGRPPTDPGRLERVADWVDERTGAMGVAHGVLRKVFPDHWSFLLGEVALFSFVIIVATGIFLTFFFSGNTGTVIYEGPYTPLRGTEVSSAFDSVMRLSFEVRAGLLIRQIHHWAALLFVTAIVVHVARVFFTGAFRRPREINWLVGVGLLLLGLAAGLTGYSLPDDLLSGTGLRIAYSVAMSIPFIGPYLAYLLFGGEFPTAEIIGRFYAIHILILPALLVGLISAHVGIMWFQKHTQFPGRGATESNVVGRHFWPSQVFRSVGLLLLLGAVLAALGGLVQINPVWIYGPFDPTISSSPAQPDWYLGWLEGTLRLGPNWEPTILGVTLPSPLLPAIIVPGILFAIFTLWPFIEARIAHDHEEHNLLQWPWQAPLRFAFGVAALTAVVVLTIAGGNDVLATLLQVGVEDLTVALRVLVFVLPVVAGFIAYRLAVEHGHRVGGLPPADSPEPEPAQGGGR